MTSRHSASPLYSGPTVNGKFLEVAGERFLVKGVAYGTFAPDANGLQYPEPARVAQDFGLMAAAGLNTVRCYTVPPEWLLDEAARHDLKVMVGMPWAQHIAFLGDRALTQQIRREAVDTVRRLASHPAALLFAVGNEIPPSVVRWHGEARVVRFLQELYDELKSAAPQSLLTYVNFPPTEYLDLDFFDVCAFNVYLHRQRDLRAYLGRLQHIAGYKPLLLAEAGGDSIREGLDGQAAITEMHLRTAFSEGACGAVAFSWTDEWWRGGQDVNDWAFGLVDRDRQAKPALAAVSRAFAEAPFTPEAKAAWPKVSVVVCAYNASDTIEDTLQSLGKLTYPDYEVIVINDGSRDRTGEIAHSYPVRTIDIPNGGLSAARNLGLAHATGEIVAYTDADVRVDPDWLTYLVQPIVQDGFQGSGGPNVIPADDPWVAQCVARAPGGPTHVLLDDRVAEHVPGCNMAFRRAELLSIGGFNPAYLRAGDDVDVCWRLQARGYRIGFAPSALVWHHHRSSVKAYWRQQVGYGEGETWLDAHHPEKFVGGQMLWRGRIYSPLPFVRSLSGRRLNTGVWGSAPFPSVYRTDQHPFYYLPHSPAWMVASSLLCLLGLALTPNPRVGWALLVLGLVGWIVTMTRCVVFARRSDITGLPPIGTLSPRASRLRYRALIAWMHLIQPIARLYGRMRGLWSPPQVIAPEHVSRAPWKAPLPTPRDAATSGLLALGMHAERSYWSESWIESHATLNELAGILKASRPAPHVHGDDGWHADRDLSLPVGRWGWLHVRTLIEEHAQGRCLLRVGTRLRPSSLGVVKAVGLVLLLAATTSAAIALRWPAVSVVTACVIGLLFLRGVWQTTRVHAVLDRAVKRLASAGGMLPLDAKGVARAPRPRRVERVTAGQFAQAAAVVGMLAVGAFSVFSLSRVLGREVPAAAAPATAAAGDTGSTGGMAVTSTGDVIYADGPSRLIRRLRVRLPLEAARPTDALDVLARSTTPTLSGATVRFATASDVAIAPNGDLFVADARNHRICRIDRGTGKVITVAGYGWGGFDGDDKQAAEASLDSPMAVAVARNGDLYIADTGSGRIRMVSAQTGLIQTVAGGGQLADGSVGDGGPATAAALSKPSAIAIGPDGDLYIADTGNHRVRRVDSATGVITTIAGNGVSGSGGDRGPATAATLMTPTGLALVPSAGRLAVYIADPAAGAIRIVGGDGTMSTMSTGKRFVAPTRVAYHPTGWLLVKDARANGLTAVRVSRRTPFELAQAPRKASGRKVT